MQAPESQLFNLDLLDRELHLAPAVTALLFRKVTKVAPARGFPRFDNWESRLRSIA